MEDVKKSGGEFSKECRDSLQFWGLGKLMPGG